MPAGFNKGQIEYIKTIANVNGHKTYHKTTVGASQARAAENGTATVLDPHVKFKLYCLGPAPLVYDHASSTALNAISPCTSLDVYNIAQNSDQEAAGPQNRVTPECFLESVSVKMRQIVDLDETVDHQSHKEYRLMVFRHREKQHATQNLAENFSNPLYDLWHGASNYKYGVKGWRGSMDHQGNLNYIGGAGYDASYDRDAMMTDPINTEDYVVMKDCRYYLGREYGGKHIYEDRFRWDHEDPIATDLDDITSTDSNKNYCWYIMLIGANNSVGAASAIDYLGYINLRSNTHVTSG
jgi:hypothetical protein